MFSPFALFFALVATLVMAETHGITPHDMYSSSQGVLDCDNICVKVSYSGRSVNLLRIDQSGGAYDISYDAWNYLYTGKSAHDAPATGGAINMDVSFIPASECASLLKVGRLPLSASNPMNYLSNCLNQPNSWVANHFQLYNIQDAVCHYGWDEECTVNLAVSNQPNYPHALGTSNGRLPDTVFNIQYGTGAIVAAP